MPQLETSHILLDTLLLLILSFISFSFITYITCTTASYYYISITKYIINITSSFGYFIKKK